jgi:hypothetical protein
MRRRRLRYVDFERDFDRDFDRDCDDDYGRRPPSRQLKN